MSLPRKLEVNRKNAGARSWQGVISRQRSPFVL